MPEETKNPTEQKKDSSDEQQDRASTLNQNRLQLMKKKLDKSAIISSFINNTPGPIPLIHFVILLVLALFNDIGDWFGLSLASFRLLELTGAILFFYCYYKGYNKKTIKVEWWFATILIELIPVVGDIITSWTIFIIYVYRKSHKDFEMAQTIANAQNQETKTKEQETDYDESDYDLEELQEAV